MLGGHGILSPSRPWGSEKDAWCPSTAGEPQVGLFLEDFRGAIQERHFQVEERDDSQGHSGGGPEKLDGRLTAGAAR